MTNDLETSLRTLEEATAAGDPPVDRLDPETASLREAWLALGEILEAAQPSASGTVRFPGEKPIVSVRLLEERANARAAYVQWRWRSLSAAALLAAAVLVGVATVWTLFGASGQDSVITGPKETASTDHKVTPSTRAHCNVKSATDEPQWDDSLDEQIEQVQWQMLCVRENQTFRTDAFGRAQYRLEQFRETIQADSL
jgi:hypothetical protein